MVVLRSNIPNQQLTSQLPALEMLIWDRYERQPDYVPMLFNMDPISGSIDQDLTVTGLKAVVQKNEGENATVDAPIEGYSKTYIPLTYELQVGFSQELIEDDKLQFVKGTYQSLGDSMYQTRQTTAFNIFNDGFTDTGPDGVSLFNSAHPMIAGHTYGNRPSTDVALSIAGLREMDVDIMRQPNHRNLNIALSTEYLLVPPELMHTALELIKSQDRPDTDNRAVNVHYGTHKCIVSRFLTSQTAWFGLSSSDTHHLKFRERLAPSTKTWQDEGSGDVNTKIRARWVVGYSDFIGVWGTTG